MKYIFLRFFCNTPNIFCNRSRFQRATFRVKDKDGIDDPKSSSKMLIFPNNYQFCPKFRIRPDEADAFLVNTHPKCNPGTRMEPAGGGQALNP